MTTPTPDLKSDLIRGPGRIGAYIGHGRRKTLELLENGHLPALREASTWVTKKSALDKFYGTLEAG